MFRLSVIVNDRGSHVEQPASWTVLTIFNRDAWRCWLLHLLIILIIFVCNGLVLIYSVNFIVSRNKINLPRTTLSNTASYTMTGQMWSLISTCHTTCTVSVAALSTRPIPVFYRCVCVCVCVCVCMCVCVCVFDRTAKTGILQAAKKIVQ